MRESDPRSRWAHCHNDPGKDIFRLDPQQSYYYGRVPPGSTNELYLVQQIFSKGRMFHLLHVSTGRSGTLIQFYLVPGRVIVGVEETAVPQAFHRAQGLVHGGDALAIEFDGSFAPGGAHAG